MADDREPERTKDGRWIVVDGRRWRASDPSIPERFRKELVDELMDARRAVGGARRSGSSADERVARDRVQAAKEALGERGRPWWEDPEPAERRARIAATTLALAGHRGPDRTICPSDVARTIGGDGWRALLDEVRSVARDLADDGEVEITQRGAPIDPRSTWRGPVRIRRAASPDG